MQPEIDEGLSDAVWPPLPRPSYLVSEALPLHRLGLVPPPPEIGPHLLDSTPIEAALAAAEATAEQLAIAPPELASTVRELSVAAVEEPESVATASLEASAGEPEATHTAMDRLAGITGGELWSDAPLLTDPDSVKAIGSGDGGLASEALPRAAEKPLAADGADVLTDFAIREPQTLAAQTDAADVAEPAADEQGGGLARLDLSRRAETPPLQHIPLPPSPDEIGALAMADRPQATPPATQPPPAVSQTIAQRRGTMNHPEPPAGNWPGFLAGFVMALAIGVGLYVSWVG